MKQEYKELAKEMLNVKNREEAKKLYIEKDALIKKFAKEGGKLAYKALAHISVVITPEDYDDDICD